VPSTDFSPDTIFISYSRSDGRGFAEKFERRLEEEAGIHAWRDLKSIVGGEDIRPQVLRAIEQVKHLVVILSPRALASDWVKREWTHAREKGKKVSPVLADPTIKRGDLPAWIRRADVYDIAERERWEMLVQVLKGPGETRQQAILLRRLPQSGPSVDVSPGRFCACVKTRDRASGRPAIGSYSVARAAGRRG
jgi:hypothetical protein